MHRFLVAKPQGKSPLVRPRRRWEDNIKSRWRAEMCTWFWWGNLRERDHWRYPDVDGSLILRWMEDRYVHRVLVRKLDGKRPLGRP
jgi:hypothetical protein